MPDTLDARAAQAGLKPALLAELQAVIERHGAPPPRQIGPGEDPVVTQMGLMVAAYGQDLDLTAADMALGVATMIYHQLAGA